MASLKEIEGWSAGGGGVTRRLTATSVNWNKDTGRNNAILSSCVVSSKAVETVYLL